MKTFYAIAAHAGIGALQAVAAHGDLHGLAQGCVQGGLMLLQAYVAHLNSSTDPKGAQLVEVQPGKYVTAK